jgi:6-phosphogluconolactonase
VNEIDTYRGLPRGAVEAFTIDVRNGRLTKLNQQPLSLSGTMPRDLAISPDGLHAVIAVYGGGAYNVLPIAGDGSLGDVCGILKETGSGPHPEHQGTAHPHTVLFDSNGRYLLGTDIGSDRLNVFALTHGRITPVARNVMPLGSGPAEIAIHPLGHLLFVVNQLEATISSFSYSTDDGTVGDPLHVTRLLGEREAGTSCSLLVHPSGRFLYTNIHTQSAKQNFSNGTSVWRVHPTGSLSLVQFSKTTLLSSRVVAVSCAGNRLYLMDRESGAIFSLPVSMQSGCIGTVVMAAKVPMPRSLVMKRT